MLLAQFHCIIELDISGIIFSELDLLVFCFCKPVLFVVSAWKKRMIPVVEIAIADKYISQVDYLLHSFREFLGLIYTFDFQNAAIVKLDDRPINSVAKSYRCAFSRFFHPELRADCDEII